MTIYVYAEHLINIRTLTIQVSLPSNSDESTALIADGVDLLLSHQGEALSITLPTPIPDSEISKLSIPAAPSKNFTFRIKLGDADSTRESQSTETTIPWTAASLSRQVELQCKECHAELLPRAKIQTWKDLPSEGWAEMMEFWHCHKPNEPYDHEHQTDKKGYSADSMLAITPSVGLVNATSFVLAGADCRNINMRDMPGSPNIRTQLDCASCNATVGVLDATSGSHKLSKMALSVSLGNNHRQDFDSAKWLTCHLLNSMDNQGLRRFIVTSRHGSRLPLSIWLFTPDLNIASSAAAHDMPLRVTKVLWKPAPLQSQDDLLNKQSMSEGEIEVTDFQFDALAQSLEHSVVLLPEGARRFQEWEVVLLERFTVHDGILQ